MHILRAQDLSSSDFFARAMRITICVLMVLAIALAAFPADAAKRKKRKYKRPAYTPPYAAIVIDYKTGKILRSKNADRERHPASLTKMMTLYIVYDGLDSGLLTLDTKLRVSERVAAQPRTKLWLNAGETITVREAILGLVTKSANDAAMLLGEALAGTEERFARTMTLQAKALGMKRTTFKNASGLPDKGQVTTARDMAVLSVALIRDFPHYYHFFSTKKFTFNGRNHSNHNRMLRTYPGTDGIKTGFIYDSGFNLAASAVRKGRRVIGVVLGGRSSRHRAGRMSELFDHGFAALGIQKARKVRVASNTGKAGRKVLMPKPKPGGKASWAGGWAKVIDPGAQKVEKAVATSGTPGNAGVSGGIAMKPTAPGAQAQLSSKTISQTAKLPEKSVVRAEALPKSATGPKPAAPVSVAAMMRKKAAAKIPGDAVARKAMILPAAASKTAATPGVKSKRNGGIEVTLSEIPKHPTQPGSIDRSAAKWGIQVGAFKDLRQARVALAYAINKAPVVLQNAEVAIVPVDSNVGQFYRARILGMNSTRAQEACRVLHLKQVPCIPLESPI